MWSIKIIPQGYRFVNTFTSSIKSTPTGSQTSGMYRYPAHSLMHYGQLLFYLICRDRYQSTSYMMRNQLNALNRHISRIRTFLGCLCFICYSASLLFFRRSKYHSNTGVRTIIVVIPSKTFVLSSSILKIGKQLLQIYTKSMETIIENMRALPKPFFFVRPFVKIGHKEHVTQSN